jgi:hypothetical protein
LANDYKALWRRDPDLKEDASCKRFEASQKRETTIDESQFRISLRQRVKAQEAVKNVRGIWATNLKFQNIQNHRRFHGTKKVQSQRIVLLILKRPSVQRRGPRLQRERAKTNSREGKYILPAKRARTEVRALIYLLVGLIVRAKARTYLRDNRKDEKQIPAGWQPEKQEQPQLLQERAVSTVYFGVFGGDYGGAGYFVVGV